MALIQVRKLDWASDGDCQYCETGYGTYIAFRDPSWVLVLGSYDDDDIEFVVKCGRADSLESAIAACQADFERRVLAEIEVPLLVWCRIDEDCWLATSPHGLVYYAWNCGNIGRYSLPTTDLVRGMLDAEDFESAKAACNAHNRRLILGEHGALATHNIQHSGGATGTNS